MHKKKILKAFLPLLTLFFTVALSATATEKFTYCSNGTCRLIDGGFFHASRGMPLDLKVVCQKNNQYALTFDDGPSANYPRLLDLLKRHGVKATFFVVGGNLNTEEAKQWLARAVNEGHFIANHTMNHADLTGLNDSQIVDQVELSRAAMRDALCSQGLAEEQVTRVLHSALVVRPPFGNIDGHVDSVFKSHGFTSVRWNADRYDWQMPGDNPNTAKTIVDRLVQQLNFIELEAKKGSVFNRSILDLNHDWQIQTLDALETMIPLLKSKGYEPVTMDRCLGLSTPEENP